MDSAIVLVTSSVKALLSEFDRAPQAERWQQDQHLERRHSLYGTRRQEEEMLNLCLVGEVFVQLFATGFGFLSSIWATVVLLGSFGTMLFKMDFWVATVIVFIQTAGRSVILNIHQVMKYTDVELCRCLR